MEFSVPIFVVLVLIGVFQLAVGVVAGRCRPIRKPNLTRPGQKDRRKIRRFARRLYQLVDGVADDVGHHQTEIRQLNQELASAEPGEGGNLTEFVLKTAARIMQINERLQNRLTAAEEKLQQQTEQIESQIVEARTDPLTGLPNRRAFDDQLHRRVAEWKRKQVTFCLMMIDIDHFKQLNDEHGHPAGDHVLREVAELLGHMLREMDMIARIGGEEFAIILPSTNLCDGQWATQRIRSAVASQTFFLEQTQLQLTVSLGLAEIRSVEDDSVSLVKRADEALYAAKRAGRNCAYVHNGLRCQRIDRFGQPPAEPPPSEAARSGSTDDPAENAEMAAICQDLRKRLGEVANEGVHPPAGDSQRR